jgi:hypothetical protein
MRNNISFNFNVKFNHKHFAKRFNKMFIKLNCLLLKMFEIKLFQIMQFSHENIFALLFVCGFLELCIIY